MRNSFLYLALITTLFGCELGGPTKMAKGEPYASGDARFDPYFDAVHKEQAAAKEWPDEAKNARRPIVAALNLKGEASNYAILNAVKEKKGDPSLGHAVAETTAAEQARAKRMNAIAEKLAEMKKHGEDLRKQATDDRHNMGADKADEAKVKKKEEVKREINAAVSAVDSMEDDARSDAKDAEQLAQRLGPAWGGKMEPLPAPASDEKKEEAKKEEAKKEEAKKEEPKEPPKKEAPKKPSKPAPPAAEKKPDAPPAEKPEKKQPPPAKGPDEVFNP